MIFLTRENIIHVNKRITAPDIGGLFVEPENLLNPESLEWLIEAVEDNLFGKSLYPDEYSKAASYAFHIIKKHIFNDGNKRTAIASTIAFLRQNGYTRSQEISSDELTNFALDIESDKLKFDDIVDWIRGHFEQI